MSWALSLQDASYKDVGFDVQKIDDHNSRVLVDHQYPYVDGGDIEDMGAGIHEVKLTAIYWGEMYETKLNRLLNILQNDVGAGILVHPVFGRMPDMIPVSWSAGHEADWVNYVTLDLTFRKATKGNPIFASVSVLGALDSVISKVQDLIDAATNLYDQFEAIMGEVKGYKSQFKGMTAVFKTVQTELKGRLKDVSRVLSLDSVGGKISPVQVMQDATKQLIESSEVSSVISPLMSFDSVMTTAKSIIDLPLSVTNKTGTTIDLGVPMVARDALEIRVITDCVVIGEVVNSIVDIIYDNDELSPIDIEKIVNTARGLTQNTIDMIRNSESDFIKEFNTYDGFYMIVDHLRQIQHQLKEIAVRIIAKKPPLIMRLAPFDGTLHQISHHFYNDFNRFDELLRLNPHIKHPSFIKQGDYINGYSR